MNLSEAQRIEPLPIPVRDRYFYTRCEHCGWEGSSEQVHLARYWDDADCVCPACLLIFLCDEVAPAGRAALQEREERG